MGLSASAGVTMGSAAAIAAGVAFAAAQGIIQGAPGKSVGQLALPDQPVLPPPVPSVQMERPPKGTPIQFCRIFEYDYG